MSKKEYILEGLGCANCAAKMEAQIKNLPGVQQAFVNFGNSTLAIEADLLQLDQIAEDAKKIIVQIEPGIVVQERTKKKDSPNNAFLLLGLSCAGCSAKIEDAVRALPGVENASLDFVLRKLTVQG
ncbi:MAG: cation transporter, partial [Firmicutes bacterium]|nr:cation transporter [Bacillota bacterium]